MKAAHSHRQFFFFNHLSKLPHQDVAVKFNKQQSFANSQNSTFSQREFISAIIHELKTPLNAIIGFSETLQQEIKDLNSAEKCADYAKEITQAAVDLNDLVHDLLDVGNVNSRNFSVNLSEEIDMKSVITRAIKLNCTHALRKKIIINAEIADDISLIKLDIKRMKQVVTNLVSNAIKYSSNNSKIIVSAKNLIENNKKYLQIIVADQGFGISPEQINDAFQKFKTIPNPNSEIVDSFGMGLPIVKQLVELQNGTIEVKSEVNKGTEITLKFPYLM